MTTTMVMNILFWQITIMVNNSVEAEGQGAGEPKQPPPPEEDIVTPHTVLASSNKGVDYDKLVGKENFLMFSFLCSVPLKEVNLDKQVCRKTFILL